MTYWFCAVPFLDVLLYGNTSWNFPKHSYTTPMAMQILSIIDKICSSAQRNMSHTVTNLVKKFQGSAFFKSVFPDFVNETIEDGR